MDELINYLKKQANAHKVLADNLSKIDDLAKLDNLVSERQTEANALQKAIDDRTADLKALATQVAYQQDKLTSEALKATQDASKKLDAAEDQAEAIVNAALDKQIKIMTDLERNRTIFMDQIDAAKNDLAKLKGDVTDQEQKYTYWVDKITALKASI